MITTSTVRRLARGTRPLAAALLLTAPAIAGAQEAGTIEVGVGTRRTAFDESLGLDAAWGPAVQGGWFVRRAVSLEAQLALATTRVDAGGDVRHRTTGLRALLHRPARGAALHAGLGWSRVRYAAGDAEASEDGASLVVGARRALLGPIGARMDATADWYPWGASGEARARQWNWALQVGFTWRVRGRLAPEAPPPPPDSDGDGVVDADDRCGGTPMGEPVDARGCAVTPAPPSP